ncbi:flagellar hook-basal body complex protein FliE [Alteromonas sp. S015]|uniref:flagellar hook-basal body complex protein FliE n=1 Tax=Alteromonas sp. S015 TaxID=3117401 RepID=UPI002FDF434E
MISPIHSQASMISWMEQVNQANNLDSAPLKAIQNNGVAEDFAQVIQNINHDQNLASEMMKAVDTGQSQDVVGAMVASQKASLSFSMLVEVRNKVMNSFDDVMRMSL